MKTWHAEQRTVGVCEIVVVPGHNPRTYFDEREMSELRGSIKAQGVLQPLLVRPRSDGKFDLIAGERRLRAAREVLGEGGCVPVLVRECADAEMHAMAIIENAERSEMSPANEAEGAHRLMLIAKGDREEVAAQLGWNATKLDRRLALMRANGEVRQALTERKITLGHAELLAAVPQDKQSGALKTIIERGLSVGVLRKEIGKITNALESAAFDKAECATCMYSTAQQNSLFSESLAAGYCTNSKCWDEKTLAHVEGVAASLREEVPRVEVLRADGSFEAIKLIAEGGVGVGVEQAKMCRACTNFGCTVSAMPGSVGQVDRSMCFDSVCHTEKVALQIKVTAEAGAAARKAAEEALRAGGGAGAAQRAANEAEARVRESANQQAAAGAVSNRVKEYRTRVWRQAASKAAFSSADKSRDVLIALALSGNSRHIDARKMQEVVSKLGGAKAASMLSVAKAGASIVELPEKVKSAVVNALSASAMANIEERDLKGVLHFLGVRLENYWSLNEEFLGLLTKSEIYAVCNEVGLVARIGEAKFKAAMNGKKEELIKVALGVKAFNYKGVVPRSMLWEAGDVLVDQDVGSGDGRCLETEPEQQEQAG